MILQPQFVMPGQASIGAFSPLDLSPELFLSTSVESTLDLASNALNAWSDQSINNSVLTAPTTIARPTYAANQLNGHGIITFNGVNSVLQGGYSGSDASQTVFLVLKINSYINFGRIFGVCPVGKTALALATITAVVNGFTDGKGLLFAGPLTRPPRFSMPDEFHVVAIRGLTSLFVTIDGVEFSLIPQTYTELGSGNLTSGRISLGARWDAAFSSSSIAAAILINGVMDYGEEWKKCEGWLSHTFGLTENLPSDHPYKMSPP
jgi:hypothetical protein